MGVKEKADVTGLGNNLGNGRTAQRFCNIHSVIVLTCFLHVSKSALLCSTDLVTHAWLLYLDH